MGEEQSSLKELEREISAQPPPTVLVTVTEEKEQKAPQKDQADPKPQETPPDEQKDESLRAAGSSGAAPTEDKVNAEPAPSSSIDATKNDKILESLADVSKLFREELRDALRRIEEGNEKQATNSSNLLSEILSMKTERGAGDDMVAPGNMASRIQSQAACCRV